MLVSLNLENHLLANVEQLQLVNQGCTVYVNCLAVTLILFFVLDYLGSPKNH